MTPTSKVWVVGGLAYSANRHSWQKPTQQQAVYDAVKAAGVDGATAEQVVDALRAVEFDKGTGCSKKNVDYYLNALRKAGYIAERGAPGSVSATASSDDALYAALAGLESALAARIRDKGKDADMTPIYERYKTFKSIALRPKTANDPKYGYVLDASNEVIQGLRLALVEMIKLVVR